MLALEDTCDNFETVITKEDPLTERFRQLRKITFFQYENKKIVKDVHVINDNTGDTFFFQDFQMNINEENQLLIDQLVENLKKSFVPVENAFLYIWDERQERFIWLDQYPLLQPYYIDFVQYIKADALYIKFRNENIEATRKHKNLIETEIEQYKVKEEEMEIENTSSRLMNTFDDNPDNSDILRQKPREKRVKERTIQYVRQKVLEWRGVYKQGYGYSNGELVKINLDTAANMVGLSRKTLDDYFSVIKQGESYDFDFELNKNQKMGCLRKFVKDSQKNSKLQFSDNAQQQQIYSSSTFNTNEPNQIDLQNNQQFHNGDEFLILEPRKNSHSSED